MPYKRRLRVLWFAADHPQWATQACHAAAAADADRTEHRAAATAIGKSDVEWADLILTVDAVAERALPMLPARVQVRAADLAAAADAATRRTLVEARVAGILGGLRLLERVRDPDLDG